MRPDWDAGPRVGAAMSTRGPGASAPPFGGFNLGDHVGDDPAAVQANRAAWARRLGARPAYLKQVHGTTVVHLGPDAPDAPPAEADAAVTSAPGVACTVLVADCLPVLLAATDGRAVGAAHAGWRGLAGGVVEAALRALCDSADCTPADVAAWLGPCIGPRRFEVGAEVLAAFGAATCRADAARRFTPRPRPDGSPRWLADLAGLARDRLASAGVLRVAGGRWCTVEDASRFFSFRRDGVTGRMAASVWIR
jgi:YfiH family protein